MRVIDPALIQRIKKSIAESRIDDRKKLQATKNRLDELGRYHVDQTVREHGYEAVLRVFATRICDCSYDFEGPAIALARQIPDPYPQMHDWHYTNMHPCLVQNNFLRLLKPNLIEK
jgi:hypothetical protein